MNISPWQGFESNFQLKKEQTNVNCLLLLIQNQKAKFKVN